MSHSIKICKIPQPTFASCCKEPANINPPDHKNKSTDFTRHLTSRRGTKQAAIQQWRSETGSFHFSVSITFSSFFTSFSTCCDDQVIHRLAGVTLPAWMHTLLLVAELVHSWLWLPESHNWAEHMWTALGIKLSVSCLQGRCFADKLSAWPQTSIS